MFLLLAVVVPVVGEAIRQIGPLVLASRPQFDDLMDGLTFGVISGVSFACFDTIVRYWDLLTGGVVERDPGLWVSLIFLHGFVKPLLIGTATGIACAEYSGLGRGYDGFTPRYFQALALAVGANIAFQAGAYLFGFVGDDTLGVVLSLGWGLMILAVLILRMRSVLHVGLMEAALERTARAGGIGSDGDLDVCARCELPLMEHAAFCNACGTAVRIQDKAHRVKTPSAGAGRRVRAGRRRSSSGRQWPPGADSGATRTPASGLPDRGHRRGGHVGPDRPPPAAPAAPAAPATVGRSNHRRATTATETPRPAENRPSGDEQEGAGHEPESPAAARMAPAGRRLRTAAAAAGRLRAAATAAGWVSAATPGGLRAAAAGRLRPPQQPQGGYGQQPAGAAGGHRAATPSRVATRSRVATVSSLRRVATVSSRRRVATVSSRRRAATASSRTAGRAIRRARRERSRPPSHRPRRARCSSSASWSRRSSLLAAVGGIIIALTRGGGTEPVTTVYPSAPTDPRRRSRRRTPTPTEPPAAEHPHPGAEHARGRHHADSARGR